MPTTKLPLCLHYYTALPHLTTSPPHSLLQHSSNLHYASTQTYLLWLLSRHHTTPFPHPLQSTNHTRNDSAPSTALWHAVHAPPAHAITANTFAATHTYYALRHQTTTPAPTPIVLNPVHRPTCSCWHHDQTLFRTSITA